MGDVGLVGTLTLGAWAVLELGLRIRERVRAQGTRERDRGTRIVIGLTLGGAVVLAAVSTSWATSLRMPGLHAAAGPVFMWVGLGIRVWAVVTLGRSFRTTVEVDRGQAVVSRGPYRRIRHPAYTGLLLITAGIGLAVGNWLALAGFVVLPLIALLWRIHVEEAELVGVLGDPYRVYRRQTKRLIPGVW